MAMLYLRNKPIGAISRVTSESVSVTADGVKSLSTLLDDLFALIDMTKVGRNAQLVFPDSASINTIFHIVQYTDSVILLSTAVAWTSASESAIRTFFMQSSGSKYYFAKINGSVGDGSSGAIANGLTLTFYY